MSSTNLSVLSSVSSWLSHDHAVFLITVLNTWGAAPRPAGSLFAFNLTQGQQIGSLSGGCVEEALIDHLVSLAELAAFSTLMPCLKRYGDAEDDSGISLPCGGVLELLIEPLQPVDSVHIDGLLNRLNEQKPACRKLMYTMNSRLVSRSIPDQLSQPGKFPVLQFDPLTFTLQHRLDPTYRLLIVGAGDVAYYLSDMARSVEFSVTLCEPRVDILNRLPDHYRAQHAIVNALPDDLIRKEFNDEFTAIVCLSHDPRVDDMALIEALQHSRAFYVGAMGSLNTSQARRQRLRSLGLNESHLSKLNAPIGLDISSKTPPEIAISILAQLIRQRGSH